MKNKRFYIWISSFFLFLLFAVKGLGYHSVTHNEADEAMQCELCTFVVNQESQEYSSPSPCEIPLEQTIIFEDQDTFTAIPACPRSMSPESLFSRPPPVWV